MCDLWSNINPGVMLSLFLKYLQVIFGTFFFFLELGNNFRLELNVLVAWHRSEPIYIGVPYYIHIYMYIYRRTIEPAYHYLTIIGVGALPGTYVHRLRIRARFYDFNKSTRLLRVRWLIRMDGRWSGRKDMADQVLSPRHGATESPTCPIHYLEAHNSVEGTETFIRNPRANSIHRG